MMKRLLGLLMGVGLMVGMSGCGGDKDSSRGEETRELLVWKTTYDDGGVKEEYQYYHHPENNRRIKDGWYGSYHENGEYKEVGTYKDNERDWGWIFFAGDGKRTKGMYEDGERWSGEFVSYYESGKVKWEGNFVDGKLEGKSIEYDEEGNITDQDIYEDDECIEMCEGDELKPFSPPKP